TPWVNAQFAIRSSASCRWTLPRAGDGAIPICGNMGIGAVRARMGETKSNKRRKGRPSDEGVGKDALLETAKRLIREMPPARVTISLIAREAGVDPALVRYYFGDRSKLLMAVAESMLEDTPRSDPGTLEPVEAIE